MVSYQAQLMYFKDLLTLSLCNKTFPFGIFPLTVLTGNVEQDELLLHFPTLIR